MIDPMPLRLHRAVSILSRTGDPGAADAQSACAETAAHIVVLEEALIALLSGKKGAAEQARRVCGDRVSGRLVGSGDVDGTKRVESVRGGEARGTEGCMNRVVPRRIADGPCAEPLLHLLVKRGHVVTPSATRTICAAMPEVDVLVRSSPGWFIHHWR